MKVKKSSTLHRLPHVTALEMTTARAVDTMIEVTRRPSIRCCPIEPSALGPMTRKRILVQSRFGGQYAWPKNAPPPLAGCEAFCLLQINLADLPRKPFCYALPKTGLLQVFIRPDNTYGCDLDRHRGDGFRIVLHSTDLENLELSKPLSLSDDENASYLPIGSIDKKTMMTTGVPITFDYDRSTLITSSDYRFTGPTLNVLHDVTSNTLCSAAFEKWYDERVAWLDHGQGGVLDAAWLGGHPMFCYHDIRFHHHQDHDDGLYDAFLSFASDGYIFNWGDMGTATFLVPRSGDLSRTLYTWDSY